ncbi:MAG: FAD-dependent oxidoreductase [Deltaproteobacteria bacterium]|nr:FAD-dependent oxidoreductase [Deltaproteobacteria bacterium]
MIISKKYNTDVLVVGGGVAGVSAALTAARAGVRTLLLESHISLGGLATNGYISGVAGMVEGNCKEWLERIDAEGYLFDRPHLPTFDPERAKLILEHMLLEAGVKILYGTYAIDTMVENNNIKEVICHSKSGRMAIAARIVIDTTGDADVSAFAGVPYEVGSPEFAGLNMSTTLAFRMANVNMTQYDEAVKAWMAKETADNTIPSKMSLIEELAEKALENGDLPFFIFPTALIYKVPGTPHDDADVTVITTHSFHTRNLDVEDLTRQVIEQRRQITWIEKFFRKYLAGFERSRVSGLASQHGVRDSRRIIGEYILKDEDIACGTKFEDGIARFPEFYDTHHPTSPRLGFMRHIHLKEPKGAAVCRPAQCSEEMHPFGRPGGYEARKNPGEYCEIPYRSLVPLGIDNLLVAGRCVSAEFNAVAAVRVIAPSMTTGQAAGVAAAFCLKDNIVPRNLDGTLVRRAMIGQGVPLDKKPDGYWAYLRGLKGEHVVVPGDFVGVMTSEGFKR